MKARSDQRKGATRRGERRLGIKCETKGEAQARRRTNQVSAERLSHNRQEVISGSEESRRRAGGGGPARKTLRCSDAAFNYRAANSADNPDVACENMPPCTSTIIALKLLVCNTRRLESFLRYSTSKQQPSESLAVNSFQRVCPSRSKKGRKHQWTRSERREKEKQCQSSYKPRQT